MDNLEHSTVLAAAVIQPLAKAVYTILFGLACALIGRILAKEDNFPPLA